MTIQPIIYAGRTLAAGTRRRVFLSAELEALEPDHPLRLFVLGVCLYAGEVLNGHRPGPCRDHDARAHVRRQLIPAELLKHDHPHIDDEAEVLYVRADELRATEAMTAVTRCRGRRRHRSPDPSARGQITTRARAAGAERGRA